MVYNLYDYVYISCLVHIEAERSTSSWVRFFLESCGTVREF